MDWAAVKRVLAPPRLAGMPSREFSRSIPDVPRRRGRGRPKDRGHRPVLDAGRSPTRASGRTFEGGHFRILRAIWLRHPDEALARLSSPRWPSSLVEGATRTRRRSAVSPSGLTEPRSDPGQFARGHPRPASAASALAGRTERFSKGSYDDRIPWVILIFVLLAAAFGVLGAVIEAAEFLVLTILLRWRPGRDRLVLVKGQLRRWERDRIGGDAQVWTSSTRRSEPPRDLGPTTTATRFRGDAHPPRRRSRASRRTRTRNARVAASPTADKHGVPHTVRRPDDQRPDQQPDGNRDDAGPEGLRRPGLR